MSRKSFPFNEDERSKVCRSVLFKLTEVSVPRMEDLKTRNCIFVRTVWFEIAVFFFED